MRQYIHRLIKHENSADVAFLVLDVHEAARDYFRLNGVWKNTVNPSNVYTIGPDEIQIKFSDQHRWHEYVEE